jgi:hypothetical protein
LDRFKAHWPRCFCAIKTRFHMKPSLSCLSRQWPSSLNSCAPLHGFLEVILACFQAGLCPWKLSDLIEKLVTLSEQIRHFISAVADLGVDVNHLSCLKWP